MANCLAAYCECRRRSLRPSYQAGNRTGMHAMSAFLKNKGLLFPGTANEAHHLDRLVFSP